MRTFMLAVVVGSFLGIVACGAGAAVDAQAPDGAAGSCSAKAKPASEKVMAAIDAHTACATDADCTTISFQTTCFDSCTRSIAKSGQVAVEQAKASASEGECKPFVGAGCKVTPPPCAPPLPPACRAGKCG